MNRRWSLKLGEWAGIPVYVHWTFGLLLVWLVGMQWSALGPAAALYSLMFLLGVFLSVLLHEFGHALAARQYGIGTRHIVLWPLGGIASLKRMPRQPGRELWVALAGPLVNVVIAASLFAALWLTGGWSAVGLGAVFSGSMLAQLMWANVVMALFNLLPAFPMDGGRVLRALLATRTSYLTATTAAARVGQGMAVLFGVLGFMGNPMLVLIALFVWFAAEAELQHVRAQDTVERTAAMENWADRLIARRSEAPVARPVEPPLARPVSPAMVMLGSRRLIVPPPPGRVGR